MAWQETSIDRVLKYPTPRMNYQNIFKILCFLSKTGKHWFQSWKLWFVPDCLAQSIRTHLIFPTRRYSIFCLSTVWRIFLLNQTGGNVVHSYKCVSLRHVINETTCTSSNSVAVCAQQNLFLETVDYLSMGCIPCERVYKLIRICWILSDIVLGNHWTM
jgi:hypothetical protein